MSPETLNRKKKGLRGRCRDLLGRTVQSPFAFGGETSALDSLSIHAAPFPYIQACNSQVKFPNAGGITFSSRLRLSPEKVASVANGLPSRPWQDVAEELVHATTPSEVLAL